MTILTIPTIALVITFLIFYFKIAVIGKISSNFISIFS